MMEINTPKDDRIKILQSTLREKRRLRSLSNEDLIREYLKLEEVDTEIHVEEMMTRLWPDWHAKTEVES